MLYLVCSHNRRKNGKRKYFVRFRSFFFFKSNILFKMIQTMKRKEIECSFFCYERKKTCETMYGTETYTVHTNNNRIDSTKQFYLCGGYFVRYNDRVAMIVMSLFRRKCVIKILSIEQPPIKMN